VIVAGLGCRRGTGAADLLAALDAALAACGRRRGEIALLAAPDAKRDEAGVAAAAQALGVGVRFVGMPEMAGASAGGGPLTPALSPGGRGGAAVASSPPQHPWSRRPDESQDPSPTGDAAGPGRRDLRGWIPTSVGMTGIEGRAERVQAEGGRGESVPAESVESAAAVQPPLPPGERDGVRGVPQSHPHRLTPSAAAAKHLGLPVSPAEAAALAAAGPGARLLGPRTVAGPAVCALAEVAP
jgi:hypothetical protein